MNTEMMELFAEHTSKDYPVGVYYIDLEKMYMNSVRSHWHSELEIDYVKSGSAVFSIGAESIPLSASMMNCPKSGASLAENSTDGCELSGLCAFESAR